MQTTLTITIIDTGDDLRSIFREITLHLSPRGGMNITDQLPSLSCRLRSSDVGYKSDWHLAGDPTLIVIQQGVLRLYLRDQTYRDFGAGECFIAQDKLPTGIEFDIAKHGHRAELLGDSPLIATHVKLAQPISSS